MTPKTEDRPYFYGELVRLRLHPEAFGQVVGEEDWGRRFLVRIHGEFEPRMFDDCELLPVVPEAAAATGGNDEEPPVTAESPATAEIIDFTVARDLRKSTPTKGAA